MNSIWLHFTDIDKINYDTLTNGKITDIYMLTANWNSNYSLNILPSDAQITKMLNSAHAKGIRAHAWTIRWFNEAPLDLSASTSRGTCINAVKTLMAKGFDGHNDDLSENFSGSWQNYADYLSTLTNELHKLGKISSTDLLTWTGYDVAGKYPKIACDYICGMFYGTSDPSASAWNQTDFQATIPKALQYSPVPLLVGLYYDKRQQYTPTQELQFLDKVTGYLDHPKFTGYSLYCGDEGGYGNADFPTWINWPTKNMDFGGEEMGTKTFNGSVSAQAAAGETITITVTKPDSTKDTFTTATKADKTFSTTRNYPAGTGYKALFHVDADAEYAAADLEVTFDVPLASRTISGSIL